MSKTYTVKRSKSSNKEGVAILYKEHPEGNRENRRARVKLLNSKARSISASIISLESKAEDLRKELESIKFELSKIQEKH